MGETKAIEVVTISKEEYHDLLVAYAKLANLEYAGVKDWEGYNYTMEALSLVDPEEE